MSCWQNTLMFVIFYLVLVPFVSLVFHIPHHEHNSEGLNLLPPWQPDQVLKLVASTWKLYCSELHELCFWWAELFTKRNISCVGGQRLMKMCKITWRFQSEMCSGQLLNTQTQQDLDSFQSCFMFLFHTFPVKWFRDWELLLSEC